MQGIELAHGFLMEGLCVRRLVEVQVTAKDLVGTFSREHHLHAHGLDAPRQQVHRRGCANGGDIVSLHMPDHLRNRIQPFLEAVAKTVMHGAQRLGSNFRCGQVGRAFKANGERVQPRPPRFGAIILFDAMAGKACGAGGDQGGVEASRKQHAVGHVRHHLPMHRGFEGRAQVLRTHVHIARRRVCAPRLLVVALQFAA